MTAQGEPPISALEALASDGTLTGSWILDPVLSKVGLETRHTWGLRLLHGVFRQVTGHGTVIPAGQVTGTLIVAAGSIDTKNKMRDKDLRSAKLFDIANHPDITYTVEGMQPASGGVQVTGSLTVHGRTPPTALRREVLRRRKRGAAGRRGPRQPGGLRHDLQPDAHGVAEQHHHCPCRVHPPVGLRHRMR
jgi:polyisoprenoid-binding protein YceI